MNSSIRQQLNLEIRDVQIRIFLIDLDLDVDPDPILMDSYNHIYRCLMFYFFSLHLPLLIFFSHLITACPNLELSVFTIETSDGSTAWKAEEKFPLSPI